MITAASAQRLMRLPATLTSVTLSTTEVDEMNRPVEVTRSRQVKCWVAPETGAETADGRQVGTTRFVGYFPTLPVIDGTSRLTLGSATYEFDGPPMEWIHPLTRERIGWETRLVRTV